MTAVTYTLNLKHLARYSRFVPAPCISRLEAGPPLRFFAKVGTHAACVPDFPFATADVIVPTFTQNVKVGQPSSTNR